MEQLRLLDLIADIAQRTKIFDLKVNAIKECDLLLRCAPISLTRHHFPQLCHWMIVIQLLNFALDPRLLWVFYKVRRAVQDRFG